MCLVDDDPHQAELVAHCLSGLEVSLSVFRDPVAAETYLSAHKTDLILLDIMMPDVDGWELHARLRDSTPNGETPVIFTTCLIGESQENTMSDPPNQCVTLAKPLTRRSLLSAVAKLYGGPAPRAASFSEKSRREP